METASFGPAPSNTALRGGPWTRKPRAANDRSSRTGSPSPPAHIPIVLPTVVTGSTRDPSAATVDTPSGAIPIAPGRRLTMTSRGWQYDICRSLTRFPDAVDEFQSAAFLALVEAAQSFDSSRRVGFASFARHRIWGALCDLRREIIKRVRRCGAEAELVATRLAKGFQTGGRLIGVEPDEPVGSELEALETFENWIGQLSRLQARAFRHIYLDGKTQAETAALLGCSKWSLNRMHSQGLSLLQQTCRFPTAHAPSEAED